VGLIQFAGDRGVPPRIRSDHPLANGLGAAFESVNGKFVDITVPRAFPATDVSSLSVTRAGMALKGDGTNYQRYTNNNAKYGSATGSITTHTVALYVVRTAALTQFRRVIENGGLRSAGIGGYDISADASSGLTYYGFNGSAGLTGANGVAAPIGTPTLYVWTLDGTSNTCYINGLPSTSATMAGAMAANAGNFSLLRILSNEHTATSGLDLLSARVWPNRTLSAGEVKRLYQQYWDISRGPSRIIVPVAAGGGTSLVITDASHAHSADSLTLTVDATLAIADAAHVHTADTLVLTTDSALAIDDALHAHTADNLVLTSEHLLTVADALHAHAADNVVLTSATALTLADALHAHAADNVVLTSATALTLADALHTHAADNVVLTSEHLLTVADALHAHAADNVVLEVAGSTNLVVQDALHDHLADVLALTSAHLLIVADATHGHTVDGLTLTVASVLALQDALHAHAADNLTLDAGNGTNLLLADALHAHTADGVALTVDAWLVVADGLHAHAADNVILTIPGAFREGNPRAWIVNARQRFVQLAARTRVAHLN
jgi:hypothetical protein